MQARLYLVLDRQGHYRLTKRAPYIARGEICLRVAVNIPDACFAAPLVDVTLDVQADRVRPAEAEIVVEEAEAG
jgi:hypothetical protein